MNLDTLSAAVSELYASGSPVVQQQLFQWQATTEAWQLSAQILDAGLLSASPAADSQLLFFAAHTLQIKLRRDFKSLPQEKLLILKESLLNWIKMATHRQTELNVVLRKLILALAAYSILAVPTYWPNFIDDIQQHFTEIGLPNGYIPLLEFLTVIPEEVQHLDAEAVKKSILIATLTSEIGKVLQLLHHVMNNNQLSCIHCRALRCLQSWIVFDLPISELGPIMNDVLLLTSSSEAFESCIDVLVEFLTHSQSHQYASSICDGLINYITLGSIRSQFNEALKSDDEQMLIRIGRLITAFSETYPSYVLSHLQHASFSTLPLLQMMIQLTDRAGVYAFDEEVSADTLTFWYGLHETMLDTQQQPGFHDEIVREVSMNSLDSIPDVAEARPSIAIAYDLADVKKTISEVFIHLVRVLCRKLQFPSDDEWNAAMNDTRTKFRNYRREIGDTLIYCHYVIHNETLKEILAILNQQWLSPKKKWQHIESSIFAVKSVSEVVAASESVYMPSVVQCILEAIPAEPSLTHSRLDQTIVSFLGAYAFWFRTHPPLPMTALQYLMPFMTSQSVPSSFGTDIQYLAFRSFRDICDQCRREIAPMSNAFVEMYATIAPSLRGRNKVQLAESVADVLQAVPCDQQFQALDVLVRGTISGLEQNISDKEKVSIEVQCLCAMIRGIQLPETNEDGQALEYTSDQRIATLRNVAGVVGIIWPALNQVFQIYFNEDEILQQGYALLDTILRHFLMNSVGSISNLTSKNITQDDSLLLLPELTKELSKCMTELLVTQYPRYPSPFWMDVATTLVSIFGPLLTLPSDHTLRNSTENDFKQIANTMIVTTLLFILELQSPDQFAQVNWSSEVDLESGRIKMESRPDITETFFSLMSQIVKMNTPIFFSSPYSTCVLNLAICALRIVERQSFKSSVQFWVDVLSQPTQVVEPILASFSERLIHECLVSIALRIPRSYVAIGGEILMKLVQIRPDVTRRLCQMTLQVGPQYNKGQEEWMGARVSYNIREAFLKQVMTTRGRVFREAVKEFAAKSRGLTYS